MTAITTTLFLPFIGLHVQPAMVGPQYVNIVWVNTPQDTWNDEDKDNNRRAINSALQWWEIHTFHRSGTAFVTFYTTESNMLVDTDILSLNVCRDRSWLIDKPITPTLYMIAVNPTYRALICDGVIVGDYNEEQWAIMWGGLIYDSPTDQAVVAHTVGHLYGAADGPSQDIMDKDHFVQSYIGGIIAESTWKAIGYESIH